MEDIQRINSKTNTEIGCVSVCSIVRSGNDKLTTEPIKNNGKHQKR